MEKITLKTLADLFQVSPKTVSKVLNHKPGVREELRKAILNKAEELHYVPNLFGRGLQGGSMKTIGVILSDNTSPNYSTVLKGIEASADKHGYNIILCNSNESKETEEQKIRLLTEKHVEGIILASVSYTTDVMKRKSLLGLKNLGIPYVLISRMIHDEEPHDIVKTNDIEGGYLATKYLMDRGHRDIIYLANKYSVTSSHERLVGFRKALEQQGLPFKQAHIIDQCESTMESGYKVMQAVLAECKDFTAVLAFNDLIAVGAMSAIQEKGYRIPEDIAVIGYDDIEYAKFTNPPLTTIRQDADRIGHLAMDVLLNKINNPDAEQQQIYLPPQFIERSSV
ncbi:LacI family DNA-binding transcriptional regulator [Paenibacillus agricola]|uniref:LacI family transcriptional regulator n=1 Tax=Paenibacillus agricola TaxID=2716264 RepID=A0ABX0JAU8_9BACL|nr:LacI family DNA-binding transcriptional regulator [Paenibacillus agricola]NHN31903.1 LacI family transcriptional regulator [Paenibacillus agricola]